LVVWIVTSVAVLATIGIGVRWWRLGRVPGQVPGLPLYLHRDRVMDIYHIGGYGPALVREVQERATVTKNNKLQIGNNRIVDLVGGGSKEHQIVNTYVTHAEPAEVFGVVLNALERGHGIVHADLIDRRIDANRAWRLRKSDRLSGIRDDVYVSVSGAFQLVEEPETKGKIEFVAQTAGARVRVECEPDGLKLKRDEQVPTRPFHGTCLGRVQPWDAEAEELTILPVAILR
jgi:hypothetical protein